MSKSLEFFMKNVREILDKTGMKDFQLAKAAGLYTSQLSKYLSGQKKPSLDVIDRIAEALDTTTAMLVADPSATQSGPIVIKPTPEQALEVLRDLIAKDKPKLRPAQQSLADVLPTLDDRQCAGLTAALKRLDPPSLDVLEAELRDLEERTDPGLSKRQTKRRK